MRAFVVTTKTAPPLTKLYCPLCSTKLAIKAVEKANVVEDYFVFRELFVVGLLLEISQTKLAVVRAHLEVVFIDEYFFEILYQADSTVNFC